ncbi:MAG: polysaccharide deacetylase family protein [Planctomycetota bacterium]
MRVTRRHLIQAASLPLASMVSSISTGRLLRASGQAKIAITMDLEMARNFPTWESTHWDYEKGNLNEETRRYALEAARRVKQAGGLVHFFVVGQLFEQADLGWLQEIVEMGHPIGNHTYDHINLTATKPSELQYRFQRSPWLLRKLSVVDAIRDNVRMTSEAMQERLGIRPSGFRTPGGFSDGLNQHADVRAILREEGFDWISSLYPSHPNSEPMQEPSEEVLQGIVDAQVRAQPFQYVDGMVEVPMSPISDIGAFRNGRWKLDWFLKSLRQCLSWTIDRGAVFDFLAHPACLYVTDPEYRAIDLICSIVRDAGDRATIVDLATIARQFQRPSPR